jgi:hypothetical protein
VTDGLFLVARLIATEVGDDMSWLMGEDWPFQSIDPIDFETDKVFALYEGQDRPCAQRVRCGRTSGVHTMGLDHR